MKKTAYGKVIMVWLAWVIFCAAAQHQGLAVQAQESGSIELQLPAQAAGAELTLWRVAQARNGAFFYEDAFAESGIAIADLSDTTAAQEAAEALASYAKEQKLAGTKGTAAADGKVLFDGLTPALYLAAQSAGQEKLQVSAALVPIPYHSAGTGTEAYHAQLAPKYSVPGGAAILHKVGTHKEHLSGAQFTLQQKVYLQAGEQAPQGAESGSDAQGSFYWKELQSRLTTNAHGQLAVKNLPQAAYRFVETKAPDTYLLDSAPHEFVISEPGQLQEIDGVFSAAGGKTEKLTVVN